MTTPTDEERLQQLLRDLDQQEQAVTLYLAGGGFDGVARHLDVSRDEARRIVQSALEIRQADHDELAKAGRVIVAERTEMLLRHWAPKALNGDLQAARFVRDLLKDQRALLGLDAAQKVEHTLEAQVSPVALPVDDVLAELMEEAQAHALEQAARDVVDGEITPGHDEAPAQEGEG